MLIFRVKSDFFVYTGERVRITCPLMTKKNNNVINFNTHWRETSDQVLERLFNDHGAALRNFIRRRLGRADEVEDVVQEVFARLARVGELQHKVRGDGRNYLFTIANNLIVDQERRNALQRSFNDDQHHRAEGMVQEITPEKIVDAERELVTIKQVIMELKPSWRQAFILNRFHYMTYRQVAEQMGVTVKQVENFIAQALSRLRDVECAMQGMSVEQQSRTEK